ncbi:hypothetical protein A5707_03300 [Mycobacterium kyorinense]|uniref:Uncharacterized protein n=1 Tax=Mycobacterium kyorinense TaxID=487514 RepID=A0A1A2Z4S8_9MYCO|nr:hypothetical protein A5707_03300 [Mycobacterium kyorinense]
MSRIDESSIALSPCTAFGKDEQIAGAADPVRLVADKADTPTQHINRRFVEVVVLVERMALPQRDNGLPQDLLMAAEHRSRAAPAVLGPGTVQLVTSQRGQRELHHLRTPIISGAQLRH